MRIVVLCFLVCFGWVASAFSLPVKFDFTASSTEQWSVLTMQVDGVQLDITASDDKNQQAFVTQTSDGLGVYRGGSDSKSLDGDGIDDLLILSFNVLVSLEQVEFSSLESGDSFSLTVGNGEKFEPGRIEEFFLFDENLFSSELFIFSAEEDLADYRIKSMTVDYAPAPVPEPSTWLLLSVGVIGLAYWRRRQ